MAGIGLGGAILASAAGAGVGSGISAIAANNRSGGSGGGGLPDLLSPRSILGMIANLFTAAEQARLNKQYQADVDEQFGRAEDIAEGIGSETLGVYDQSAMQQLRLLNQMFRNVPRDMDRNRRDFLTGIQERGDATQRGYGVGMDSFLSDMAGREADLLGDYDRQFDWTENELKGYGDQQKADIDKGFANQEAAITQDLISRGLSPTSVSAVAKTLNETERSGEQRRLGEDLARNRVDLLGGILSNRTNARERLGGETAGYRFGAMNNAFANQNALDNLYASFDAAMRGDVQGAKERLQGNVANWHGQNAINKSNIYNQGRNTLLQTIVGKNFVPPQATNWSEILGLGASPSVQPTGTTGSFLQSFGPSFGQGVGNALQNAWSQPPQPWMGNQYSPIPEPQYQYGVGQGYDPYGYGPPAF